MQKKNSIYSRGEAKQAYNDLEEEIEEMRYKIDEWDDTSAERLDKVKKYVETTVIALSIVAVLAIVSGFLIAFVGGYLQDLNLWSFVENTFMKMIEVDGFWLSLWWFVILITLLAVPLIYIFALLAMFIKLNDALGGRWKWK